MSHDEAVFDSAGLALISVADDEFFIAASIAHRFPLHSGGKPSAAHAAKSAVAKHSYCFFPFGSSQ